MRAVALVQLVDQRLVGAVGKRQLLVDQRQNAAGRLRVRAAQVRKTADGDGQLQGPPLRVSLRKGERVALYDTSRVVDSPPPG